MSTEIIEGNTDDQFIETSYIEDEIKESYIDYAMSVIVGRALPDVRDGLKPVHRRILHVMNELSLHYNRPYKKSARIVGEVLGKFHPHGDMAVYDAQVRMAQDFSLRYPLVDGQGNFGSIDGDNAAAMRYTEARLQRLSRELLLDIDEDTVDFRPNFDESLEEPVVLPARVPNLLINGSSGIAVGMATNIPPHNLGEVVDATIYRIENPDSSVDDLMELIPGPDFPTAGIICSKEGIENAYKTGRGKVVIRGRVEIEENDGQKADRLIITEIPYMVNKARMIEKIANHVKNERIEGIRDLRDESDREGLRVVIELSRGASPQVVENQIYKYTRLERTFGVQMLAIVKGEPKVLDLGQVLDEFIKHRVIVIRRRTSYRLKKAQARAHILEGYRIAIANIDEVVAIIKKADSPDAARDTLIERFEISERQAKAILQMRLQRLTSMEVDKIEEEHSNLSENIAYYESVLESESKVREIIKEELSDIKERYNDERRSTFSDVPLDVSREDLIEDEPAIITLSARGYIKRTDPANFKLQHRGGRGIYGADPMDDDHIASVFSAFTHDYMLVFTSKGQCYWLKGYDIPEGGRRSRGTPIINLIDIDQDELVRAMIPLRELNGGYLVMATKNGRIKKTDLEAFSRPRAGGIIAVDMPDDDELVRVAKSSGSDHLMLATAQGKAIRFDEENVRAMGRDTRGVKGIELRENDRVTGLAVVEEGKQLLTVCSRGYGKRTEFSEYRAQTRGGMGLINIKNVDRNGEVVGIMAVKGDDELVMITGGGIIVRIPAEEINIYGRSAQGVQVMRVDDDSLITDLTGAVKKKTPEVP